MEIEKNNRRSLDLERIIISLIIAGLMFFLGFLASYSLSYSRYQELQIVQDNLRYDLLSFEVEDQFLNGSCQYFDPFRFSSAMDNTGFTIALLEKRFGKTDQRVIDKKKIYSLLEVQHFLYISDYNNKCNKSINTFLFFYSNKENEADEADRIGRILSYVKTNYPDTMIYSFDYNIDSSLINILKNKYHIDQPNMIVVDGKYQILKLENANDIEKYVKNK